MYAMRLGSVILGLAGALASSCSPSSEPARTQLARPAGAPTRTELGRAVYSGIGDGGPTQLRRGKWAGEAPGAGVSAPTIQLDQFFYLTGDLDWDGEDEAVVHLEYATVERSPTSYIAVMDRDGDTIVQRASSVLGTRVQIREARLEGLRMVVDIVQPIEDDPSSAGRLVSKTFTLRGGALVETGVRVTGTASLATLEGFEWVLLSAGHSDPDHGPPTLMFDSGVISGSLGCGGFEGKVEAGPVPTDLRMRAAVSGGSPCSPALTRFGQQYLHSLNAAVRWELHPGLLMILPDPGTEARGLVFERR
jgi:heat shock protein HslJ